MTDLPEPSATTVDFLVFAGLGFRWGLRCDVVARVTTPQQAESLPGLVADEEFLLDPGTDDVPRALWLTTRSGERALITRQRPEMQRVDKALLHALPDVCAGPRAPGPVPQLRVTALAARDHQVLFLVAEPAQ